MFTVWIVSETKKFRSVAADVCLSSDQFCRGWPTFTLTKSIAELSASAITSGAALYPGTALSVQFDFGI